MHLTGGNIKDRWYIMEMVYTFEFLMSSGYHKVLVWLVFIILLMAIDLVTGLIQAIINDNVKSGKMSKGLLKKSMLLLVLIAIVPYSIVLPEVVSIGVIVTVYFLESVMEMVSILENLYKAGLDVSFLDPLMKKLDVYKNNKIEKEDE